MSEAETIFLRAYITDESIGMFSSGMKKKRTSCKERDEMKRGGREVKEEAANRG